MCHAKFREIVPRVVEYYLVHQFSNRLAMHLRTYFRLLGDEPNPPDDDDENNLDLKSLLGEDPSYARNREEWENNVAVLSNIIDRVRKASVRNHHHGNTRINRRNHR